MPKAASTAVVAAPATLSPDELTKLLQQSGDLPTATSTFRRMRLQGGMLVTLDTKGETEDMFPPKVVKGVPQPSVTLRIVSPPKYYNAFWLGAEEDDKGNKTGAVDPNRIGRPDLANSFSKHYDNPADAVADTSPANEVYDLLVAATGRRGDFKGDIQVQIMPDDNQMTGDEPVYTLTLSASACLDWRGTTKNPTGGVVQDKNFIVQLAEFAAAQAAEEGTEPAAKVLAAMEALRLGGVVADVYILQAQNNDGSRSWPVPAFVPVHIEYESAAPALPEGDLAVNPDDIPF